MPSNPVKNIRRRGALRRPLNVDVVAGPADEVATVTTVAADAIFQRLNNNGAVIAKVLGDGVKVVPILTATPSVLEPGMVWLQEVAGTTYLYYTDNTPIPVQVPISSAPIVGPVALTDSVAEVIDTKLTTTIGSWWVDIVDTNVAPESHTSFRVDIAVLDASNINWQIYGETDSFPHTVSVTYAASIASLEITASGTGFEARSRYDGF